MKEFLALLSKDISFPPAPLWMFLLIALSIAVPILISPYFWSRRGYKQGKKEGVRESLGKPIFIQARNVIYTVEKMISQNSFIGRVFGEETSANRYYWFNRSIKAPRIDRFPQNFFITPGTNPEILEFLKPFKISIGKETSVIALGFVEHNSVGYLKKEPYYSVTDSAGNIFLIPVRLPEDKKE